MKPIFYEFTQRTEKHGRLNEDIALNVMKARIAVDLEEMLPIDKIKDDAYWHFKTSLVIHSRSDFNKAIAQLINVLLDSDSRLFPLPGVVKFDIVQALRILTGDELKVYGQRQEDDLFRALFYEMGMEPMPDDPALPTSGDINKKISGGHQLPETFDAMVDFLLPMFEGMEEYFNPDAYAAKIGALAACHPIPRGVPTFMPMDEDHFATFCHSMLSGGISMKIRNHLRLNDPASPQHQHFKLFGMTDPHAMSNKIVRRIYQIKKY